MASGSATLRLPIYKANSRLPVGKDVIECAEADYKFILQAIAAQEIQQQTSLGNKPTNILVDRRKQPLSAVKYRIDAYFSNAKSMIEAISGARQMILAYGRRVTGATLGKLQYYQQQGKGATALPVSAFNPATINIATDLYVGIPVAHSRKWQWLSRGGQRMTRISRARQMRRDKIRVSRSVFDLVAQRMKTRYRWLDITAAYIDTPNLNPRGKTLVSRIPVIKVRAKLRGRL